MTAIPLVLQERQRSAQWRSLLDTVAIGLPVVIAAAVLAWRLGASWSAAFVAIVLFSGLIAAGVWRARQLDHGWLIEALDQRVAGFEDSTALLFQTEGQLAGFAALQRRRLEARLGEANRVDLRRAWSRRPIIITWAAALVVIVATLAWPQSDARTEAAQSTGASAASVPPAITGARLRITPPAYTGLPTREQTALDARVPEGSRIEWRIDIAPRPASAALAFTDMPATPLSRTGETWSAARIVAASGLYRIEAAGMERQRLNRIDAIVDAPPAVQIVSPESQLVTVTPGQTRWVPVFEASDDYGVSASATLRITVTKGDGENITFTRRSVSVQGAGEARRRRFSVPLDLTREGMEAGSDLIVQLVVSDNRGTGPQVVEGPSVILRWPKDLEMAPGLDGMALNVVPVYFASQRQIIIDTEALIAARPSLTTEEFRRRSNEIGEAQAQLRNRYGQYLGEESEGGGGGGIALPTNDAPARPALPTNDEAEPAHAEDDHDHEGQPDGAVGSGEDVLHEFGHAHDDGDAATLFNPNTRSTLSQALDAMWASERPLRQGDPVAALPHEYRALDLLKTAQQATRIFLRRVGSDLPGVDFTRRLTGERDDIVADDLTAPEPAEADRVAADAWRALEDRPRGVAPPMLDLNGLDRWVGRNGGHLPDALGLRAAIDTVRNEPDCVECRQRLRALLWTALDRPSTAVRRRPAADERGRRYLDALR